MNGTSPVPPARWAALDCLEDILLHRQDLQPVLDACIEGQGLVPADRALLTKLVYGVCRQKGRLEYLVLQRLVRRSRLSPRLLIILSTAAYEIVFLERIPAYASVNWAVNAVKRRSFPWASGLANAVLRRLKTELGNTQGGPEWDNLFKEGQDSSSTWATAFSCPKWIIDLWLADYGQKRTRQYLRASLEAPPIGLRFRPNSQGLAAWTRWLGAQDCLGSSWRGLALEAGADISGLTASGLALRQSLAAQQALWALRVHNWQGPVWDACCGTGGKSEFLRELGYEVYCSDLSPRRLRGQWGIDNRLFRADAGLPPLAAGRIRTVLLDVPCSGLGVLSRRPDSKWKRRPKDLEDLIRLQRRLLVAAFDLLPPKGRLAYLTCTLNRKENEDQIDWLLSTQPQARLESDWTTPESSNLAEFFFAALVYKTGND